MPLSIERTAFLLLLAAVAGGLLAWWMSRWHLSQMRAEHERVQVEWQAWREQFEERLSQRPDPDWAPVLHRLHSLERAVQGIRLPTPEPTNLRPVLDALAAIRPALPEPLNLDPLYARLMAVEDSVKRAMTGGQRPLDLGPTHSRLDRLEQMLRNLQSPPASAPQPHLQPVMASLLELQRMVGSIRQTLDKA